MESLKRYSPVAFFLLVFAITWALWLPAAMTKLQGGTSLLGPDSPVGQLARWSPGLAAILLSAMLAGVQGVRKLFCPLGIWRVHMGWYLVALLIQPALLFAARWIDDLSGNSSPVVSPLASVSGPLAFVIPVMVLFAVPGSFAEELGWRGFALPALQSRVTAVIASLIIALFWGVWHLPLWLYAGQSGIFEIVLRILNFIPVSILFTWIYNNTRGSLLLVTLLHLSQQLTFAFWGIPSLTGDMLMWLVAVALVIVYGTHLQKVQVELSPTFR
jgi:membrane protease YdiL (CAAX protease family)